MAEVPAFQIHIGAQQLSKVITLTEARRRYDHRHCQHKEMIIDEQLSLVECGQCGIYLNPVDVLVRFAREEARLYTRAGEVNHLLAELEQRKRTTCQHCGKQTTITARH